MWIFLRLFLSFGVRAFFFFSPSLYISLHISETAVNNDDNNNNSKNKQSLARLCQSPWRPLPLGQTRTVSSDQEVLQTFLHQRLLIS